MSAMRLIIWIILYVFAYYEKIHIDGKEMKNIIIITKVLLKTCVSVS